MNKAIYLTYFVKIVDMNPPEKARQIKWHQMPHQKRDAKPCNYITPGRL